MIRLTFYLSDRQILGGPDWVDNDLYDVKAKSDRPRTLDELHVMFQKLLVERFKLEIRKEMRMLPAYDLVIDKTGSKLTENTSPQNFNIPIRMTAPGKIEAARSSISYFAWLIFPDS
jgi:uncharacterized protein (TIGR03435 family)